MYLRELDANLIVVLDALLFDASVTKAAERLGRSPSAVSHALSNLRLVFDDELFVRAGQKLVPTTKAMQMAPTIHVIVAGMEGLVRPNTPFDPAKQERIFNISCAEICELTILHGLRQRLQTDAPGLQLERCPPSALPNVMALRENRLDFVIHADLFNADAGDITSEALFDDPVVTLVRRGHPFEKKRISIAQFTSAEHIEIKSGSGAQDPVISLLASKGRDLNIARTVTSPLIGACLAAETDAFVSIPDTAARAIIKAMPLVPIKQPFTSPVVTTFMSWHKAKDRDECHEWLRDSFRKNVS